MHLDTVLRSSLVLLFGGSYLAGDVPNVVSGQPDAATRANARVEYVGMPLAFELNQGQADPQVKALAHGNGYGLFLTSNESIFVFAQDKDKGAPSVLSMKLLGSGGAAHVIPMDSLLGTANYFIGNDPSKWRKDVPAYGKIKYAGVYPGVDLIYYGNQEQLEYDFVVAPGANPNAIRFDIQGAQKIRIDADGDLVLETNRGEIRHHRPVVYQEIAGARRAIAGRFVLQGRHRVGFELGDYDTQRSLVIDPILGYSTYTGGSALDQGLAIAVDGLGDTFFGGTTASTDFPVCINLKVAPPCSTKAPYTHWHGGGTDGFLSILLSSNGGGSKYFTSSYFGGNGRDSVTAIQLLGGLVPDLYACGTTTSTNLPTAGGPFQPNNAGGTDAFIAHLHFPNVLEYASYLGGSGNDACTGLGLDSLGNIVVAGSTASTNFPVVNALQPTYGGGTDAFVAKIGGTGNGIIWSTYLGGTGLDVANAVTVGAYGTPAQDTVFVTGYSNSATFARVKVAQPAAGSGSHAFLTALTSDGSTMMYLKDFGGSGTTVATGLATDSLGNNWVTGYTNSLTFPTMNPLQAAFGGKTDAFATKFDINGNMLFSTYLGGSNTDEGYGVALDPGGNAFIGGWTASANYPISNALYPTFHGGQDGFVTAILSDGSGYLYSTYLGGGLNDVVTAIAVGKQGNATVTGYTNSTNFPVTLGVVQPALKGNYDAFATRIETMSLTCPVPTGTVNVPYSSALTVGPVSTPPYTFSPISAGLPGGLTLDTSTGDITGTPTTAGSFRFQAQVTDSTGYRATTITCKIAIAQ